MQKKNNLSDLILNNFDACKLVLDISFLVKNVCILYILIYLKLFLKNTIIRESLLHLIRFLILGIAVSLKNLRGNFFIWRNSIKSFH